MIISILSCDYFFLKSSSSRRNFIKLINHVLISNHLSRFICIYMLDYLYLRLDLLPFLLYKKDRLLSHRENRPLSLKKDLVKADINILRVKSSRV